MRALLVMSLAAGFDQATKVMATRALKFSPPRSYLGDLFRLTYSENPGVFLGLGGNLPSGLRFWLLTVGMGLLLFGLLAYTLLNHRLTSLQVTALALIVGSGLSNWADRVLTGGAVIDFMNAGIGSLRTGIFNFADLGIEAGVLLLLLGNFMMSNHEPLFVAKPLTEVNGFTTGIEGPNCDAQGNIYAVNLARQGTIGKVTPDGKAEVAIELPNGSIGNGIVFDKSGTMYIADYTNHNVLRVDAKTRALSVFAHEPRMNQPNDLAIAPDGTLYASDPNWKESTGQLWRIDRDGKATRLADGMGTTNGIEVSPDGKTLYVNESVQRNVWAFTITADRTLADKRLLIQFPDFGFDGMRCDVDGNLYITRHGKGTVAKVSPAGKVLQEIDVLGKRPSNLCFGGPDGRTVYVTEVDHQRLVQFRVDRPGLAWQRWQER
jgi:lipoprotein signal peptidase